MISEELTNKRAEVTLKLMTNLSDSAESLLKEGKAAEASKVADSLTLLIVKTHEVEAVNSVADSAERVARAHRLGRKHDLGDLE